MNEVMSVKVKFFENCVNIEIGDNFWRIENIDGEVKITRNRKYLAFKVEGFEDVFTTALGCLETELEGYVKRMIQEICERVGIPKWRDNYGQS